MKKKILRIIFSILGGLAAVGLVFLILFLCRELFIDWLPGEDLFLMIVFVMGVIILFSIWGDPGFPLIVLWCLISFGEAYFDVIGEDITLMVSLVLGAIAFGILSAKIYKRLK